MFGWILEYIKVIAVYLLVMYVWPSVVFRKYLDKKGMAFRFSFCTTFMILLINTVVLMLGIAKILSRWIIVLLFYGPLVHIAGAWLYRNRDKAIHIRYLLTDLYSLKRFVSDLLGQACTSVKNFCRKLRSRIGPNLLVYFMLTAVLIYGMFYFTHGAFRELYYGTTDVYVHHSWIDMLVAGQPFGAGIYPQGMHCFVYVMNTVTGVEIYSCLLFLGGIHTSAFLLSVYLFLREVLPWKYSGVLILTLYLVLQLDSPGNIEGMARLQWTLPQEFALFTVFLCGAYLLRFLRQVPVDRTSWKRRNYCRNENLLIFIMALAVSIAVHFYVTIMAFFLCAAIGMFFLFWAFAKKQVVPLLIAIACGVVLAVMPMFAAWASGIPFQGSINWAMNVIEESQEALRKPESESQLPVINSHWEVQDPDLIEDEEWKELIEEQQNSDRNILYRFYKYTFLSLYRKDRAAILAGFLLLDMLLGAVGYAVGVRKRKETVGTSGFCGYLFLVVAELLFFTMYAAPGLGLLEIVEAIRLSNTAHLLTIALPFVPLDFLMTHAGKKLGSVKMDVCALLLCLGMCVSVIATGEYHGYLYYVITRYSAAVETTNRIIQTMEPKTFTIVSPVDELYQVKGYGYHEEAVRFVHEMTKDTYTLPTEYVFIFIEKQPLEYAHGHLLEGASWLAGEKYLEVIGEIHSQCPAVYHTEISDEYAAKDVKLPIASVSYKIPLYRTILFSRLYQWAERFQELYPHQMVTVYEDDAFVCYMFRQNPARLLELAIMD